MKPTSLVLAAAAASVAAMQPYAAEHTIRLGVNDPIDTPYVQALTDFERLVEEGTDGRVDVQVFPSAQLGSIPEMFENVQAGAQEMSTIAPAYASQFFPAFDVLELPYLVSNLDEGGALITSEPFKNLLSEAEGVLGVKLVGALPFGFRNVANSVRPVEGKADLAGMKLRTQSSPVHLAAFQAMGANPVAIGWDETYQAVQTGVVDGLENSLSILISNSFPEVAPHVSTTRHVFGVMLVTMNEGAFDRLSPEDQQAVLNAFAQAEQLNLQYLAEAEASALDTLRGMGAQVVELTPEAIAELQASVQSIHDEYGPRFEPHYSALRDVVDQ